MIGSVSVVEVTDPNEIPLISMIGVEALVDDTFHMLADKYGPKSFYDKCVEDMTAAINKPDEFVFKAVETSTDASGHVTETIVGIAHWEVGYINIPKVDPFENNAIKEKEAGSVGKDNMVNVDGVVPDSIEPASLTNVLHEKVKSEPEINYFFKMWTSLGNEYIMSIRGKKHVHLRRLFVHPNHQRKGIGRKLLQFGMDTCDQQRIVGWLFARPAGVKLYESCGWRSQIMIEVDSPEFEVKPWVCMLRPRPD